MRTGSRLNVGFIGIGALLSLVALAAPGHAYATTDVVLYAADAANLHGNWALVADATAAGGQKLASAPSGWDTYSAPLPVPNDYFEFTFTAAANTPYRVWLRLQAAGNSKWN